MTDNDSDPEDDFEDQLSTVGSRTRDRLSERDRKKAEKLGVSPGSSADDDAADETAASDGGDDEGERYEYDEAASTAEKTVDAGGGQLVTDAIGDAISGLNEEGERMSVTKSEIDFVIGDEGATTDVEQSKLLYFELNGELFAGSLEHISSVEELAGLTRYPRSPDPIDGVTDMRGKIIAVLNPKVIVNLSNPDHDGPDGGGQYIIVLEEREDEHRVGIRVDDISHVETVTESDVTSIHSLTEMDLVTIDEAYLEGIVHGYRADDETQVPLIDFDALVSALKEY